MKVNCCISQITGRLQTGGGFTSIRFFLRGRGDGDDLGDEQREGVLCAGERGAGGDSSIRGSWDCVIAASS